jgi:hypothetical protein
MRIGLPSVKGNYRLGILLPVKNEREGRPDRPLDCTGRTAMGSL